MTSSNPLPDSQDSVPAPSVFNTLLAEPLVVGNKSVAGVPAEAGTEIDADPEPDPERVSVPEVVAALIETAPVPLGARLNPMFVSLPVADRIGELLAALGVTVNWFAIGPPAFPTTKAVPFKPSENEVFVLPTLLEIVSAPTELTERPAWPDVEPRNIKSPLDPPFWPSI